jgi:adenosine deaminase
LEKENKELEGVFGWRIKDFYNCIVNALKAAFITEKVRACLLERLNKFYKLFFGL